MGGLEQVLAHVGEKVLVAGEHGDAQVQLGGEVVEGGGHGLSQIAHGCAGRPEVSNDLSKAGQDQIGPLGGDLPGAEHPLSPACDDDQHGAAAGLAGGVNVEWPATVVLEHGFDLQSPSVVEPDQVADEFP